MMTPVEVVKAGILLFRGLSYLTRKIATKRALTFIKALADPIGENDSVTLDRLIEYSKSEKFKDVLFDGLNTAVRTNSQWGIRIIAILTARIINGRSDLVDRLIVKKLEGISDEEIQFLIDAEDGVSTGIFTNDLMKTYIEHTEGFEKKYGVTRVEFDLLTESLKGKFLLGDDSHGGWNTAGGYGMGLITEASRRIIAIAKSVREEKT